MGPKVENDILGHLKAVLQAESDSAQMRAATARKGLKLVGKISDHRALTYKIVMRSLWADHGEESVTVERSGSLADLMREAITEFLKVNNRSDVQAEYRVYAVLSEEDKTLYTIPIPEDYWKDYRWQAPGE